MAINPENMSEVPMVNWPIDPRQRRASACHQERCRSRRGTAIAKSASEVRRPSITSTIACGG